MKYFLVAVALILFGSCGRLPIQNIASEAREYLWRFETLGHLKVQDITIKMGTLKSNIIGLCVIDDETGTPEITLDRDYWYSVSDIQKEELIFHELGHCVLGREHNNDKFQDKCPKSLMNWQTTSKWCLEVHHSEYMKELFKL